MISWKEQLKYYTHQFTAHCFRKVVQVEAFDSRQSGSQAREASVRKYLTVFAHSEISLFRQSEGINSYPTSPVSNSALRFVKSSLQQPT